MKSLTIHTPFNVGKSSIEGSGVFAARPFAKGEEICKFQGEIITLAEIIELLEKGAIRDSDPLQIDEELYMNIKKPFVLINHSCNPNCAIVCRATLIALNEIGKGEEILFDYSLTMFEDQESIKERFKCDYWTMQCLCGEKNCRGLIDQFHTLPLEVQEKYLKIKAVPDFILKKYALVPSTQVKQRTL